MTTPTEESKERIEYKELIDTLFYGARDTTFSIPEKYRLIVMKGMARFALQQLTSSDPEDKQIVYDAFKKWAGESYESDSDSDHESFYYSDPVCYNCGKDDHFSSDCTDRK